MHAADLHLDSPLRGLTRYEGAPVERIRGATRRALSQLVELCLRERVDVLLLAGDLFDGNWRDYSTGLFFAAEMSRLGKAGVRVAIVRGNHDAASQLTRHLRLPPNVFEFASDRPQTHEFEGLGLAIHGQSFASRAVTEDLAAGYPRAQPGLFNIGLLHTALGGRVGHEAYAPCTLETLLSKGYDYWALGHVHAREVVHERPYVVFSGNLQGRHARETGEKGATLVHVEDGEVTQLTHHELDVVRWARCEVVLDEQDSADDAVDAARLALSQALKRADGRLLCARLHLTGGTSAHGALHAQRERWVAELRAVANDFGDAVWVEKVVVDTGPTADATVGRERGDAVGALVRSIEAARGDPERLAALATAFTDLRKKLPPEIALGAREAGLDEVGVDDPAFYERALGDVEQLLLERLQAPEQDS